MDGWIVLVFLRGILTLIALDVKLVYLLGELRLLYRLSSWYGQRKAALEVLHFVHFSVPRTPKKTRTRGLLIHCC